MTDDLIISAAQSRAARGLLDLQLRDVAALTGLAINTVARFEKGTLPFLPDTAQRLAQAYRAEGCVFFSQDGVAKDHTLPLRQRCRSASDQRQIVT
jgi:transcriptional regulator with XRE-family HTH domain